MVQALSICLDEDIRDRGLFQVRTQSILEGLMKSTKIVNQANKSLCPEQNLGVHRYEAGMLITEPVIIGD